MASLCQKSPILILQKGIVQSFSSKIYFCKPGVYIKAAIPLTSLVIQFLGVNSEYFHHDLLLELLIQASVQRTQIILPRLYFLGRQPSAEGTGVLSIKFF